MKNKHLSEIKFKKKDKVKSYLKPCPFCGKEPSICLDNYFESKNWIIWCSNNNCKVESFAEEPSKKEVIRYWNERTE